MRIGRCAARRGSGDPDRGAVAVYEEAVLEASRTTSFCYPP